MVNQKTNQEQMKLSIITVNWNVKPLLERCLFSIFKNVQNINYEIIVVDNDSHDGSKDFLKMLSDKRERLRLILNDKNLGFAAANNQAIKKAEAEYILFLNPDAEINNETIDKMIVKMEEDKKIGILAPKIFGVSGKAQLSIRSFPSVRSQFLIFLKLHHLLPRAKSLRKYFLNDFDYNKEQEVDQVMGAAFLTRKSILDEVGAWDENFFLWFEEVDLCKRIKQAGWKIIFNPEASVFHHGGESFSKMLTVKKQMVYNKSAIYYFKKHGKLRNYWPLLILYPVSVFISFIVQIFNISSEYDAPRKD